VLLLLAHKNVASSWPFAPAGLWDTSIIIVVVTAVVVVVVLLLGLDALAVNIVNMAINRQRPSDQHFHANWFANVYKTLEIVKPAFNTH